jgi:hypothetical protein
VFSKTHRFSVIFEVRTEHDETRKELSSDQGDQERNVSLAAGIDRRWLDRKGQRFSQYRIPDAEHSSQELDQGHGTELPVLKSSQSH